MLVEEMKTLLLTLLRHQGLLLKGILLYLWNARRLKGGGMVGARKTYQRSCLLMIRLLRGKGLDTSDGARMKGNMLGTRSMATIYQSKKHESLKCFLVFAAIIYV